MRPGRRTPLGARPLGAAIFGARGYCGPTEITALADQILRGLFEGDFAVALERAAAFCRVSSLGCADLADDVESVNPDRASELTTKALRLTQTAEELTSSARLWRAGSLD